MASTFRGKWTIYSSNNKKYMGYAGTEVLLCMRQGPGKETVVVFVLRADKELCLFLQNGRYVGPGPETFGFVDQREHAGLFEFPGHDYQNLPTSFTSKIHSTVDNTYMLDVVPYVLAERSESVARIFTIAQHTPTLEQIQASTRGDGMDLAGIDLSHGQLNNVSLIGTDFSHSNLSNAALTNCNLTKALLNNCTLVQTDFAGSNLSGANLNEVDLTGVVIGSSLPKFCTNPDVAPSATDPRTTFFKSKLKQSLFGVELSKLDLRGATLKFEAPPNCKDPHIIAKHSILTGLNENDLSDVDLQAANFDYAVLDSVNLNGCDLTNASLQFASMHETVLSDATLKSANLTGAQLGSLSELFTLPAGFETHLKTGSVDAPLREQFSHNGITLSDAATVSVLAQDRVWQLNDTGHNITYTVRLDGDSSPVLKVYKPGGAASLVNAYMPDANLSQANLYGVIASGAQFYGSKASVNGAILEKVEFNNANLSTVNFTQAQLRGANLSNSQLFNAKFNKANLSLAADGVATNLSNANLQGADFTDAELYGANLTNAAVAINVPTKNVATQGGVFLFNLPGQVDTATLDQYTAELTAAATKNFMLPYKADVTTLEAYKTALKTSNVAPLRAAFLKQKQIALSNKAVINLIEANSVWQIVDESHSYTLWIDIDPAVEDPDKDPDKGNKLFVAPSLSKTQAGFNNSHMPLRWQASVTADLANQWLIDNDSENPENPSTGYVRFVVKVNGSVLEVYGAALRILRLGDHQAEEFDTETCQSTKLSQNNLSGDTICPNGSRLSVNQSRSGKPWDNLWLRAATLPKPPACVPTDYRFCPEKPKKKK